MAGALRIAYRRRVPLRCVRSRPSAVLLIVLLSVAAAGCDAEQDLRAYFGSPAPTAGAATPSPSAAPTPDVTPSPQPPPTASPPPSPTTSPSPSPSPDPTVTPPAGAASSPSPTRPPNLPDFAVLRERATTASYDQLVARPGAFAGELLFFDARVVGVDRARGGRFRARVRLGSGDFLHLVYEERTYWGQPLVPQDRIRLVGYMRGLSDPAVHGERVPEVEVYDLVVRFT